MAQHQLLYPTRVKIKKFHWNIVFTNSIDDETVGLCDLNTKTIFIKKHLSKRQTLATFMHEWLHAVEEMYNVKLGHKIINKLEFAIADFFLDDENMAEFQKLFL